MPSQVLVSVSRLGILRCQAMYGALRTQYWVSGISTENLFQAVYLIESVTLSPKSFHEKAGESQDSFVFLISGFLPLSRAASVAILPSAVSYERFSLAASWASSIQ